MAIDRDIKQENDDLFIGGGDFAFFESESQHVADIIKANPGDYKTAPIIGVGIDKYLGAPRRVYQRVKRAIQLQLNAEGYKIDEIQIEEDQFYISGGKRAS